MAWTVDIDGTDITSICQTITWNPKLNRPASCVVRYPGHLFMIGTGTQEMHLYENGVLRFSGPVWYLQPDGSPNDTYTEATAYDHLIYLTKRLCKKPSSHPNGNFISPGSVIIDNVTGPAIMNAFLANTVSVDDAAHPSQIPFPLSVSSVAGGGVDLRSVPTEFPMTLEQMRSLLCSTGQLNLLVNPGIGSSTVDLTNGGFVNDLTGSVSIQYQTGAHNSQVASFTEDMEDWTTALWYLIGPRGPRFGRREWIPKDHWAGSITRTAANAGGDGQEPGGLPGQAWPQLLTNRIDNARSIYGYSQDVRIFDDNEDEEFARPMFEEEWANEAWIRAVPMTLADIKPQRGTAPTFSVGDLITVQAGPRLDKGFSGAQVVFEFTVQVDTEGVPEVTGLVTSGDQATS